MGNHHAACGDAHVTLSRYREKLFATVSCETRKFGKQWVITVDVLESLLEGKASYPKYVSRKRAEAGRECRRDPPAAAMFLYTAAILSAPMIKCKKVAGKKCNNMAERREKR